MAAQSQKVHTIHCCRFFYGHEPKAAVTMAKFNKHGNGRLHEEWLPTADHFRLEIAYLSHCILADAPPAATAGP